MINYESVYWTYSAAAQAIAAFVALLVAAYAVVLSMMESAAQADETLIEIHEELKRSYHIKLSVLATITAGAIIACLGVVYLNKVNLWWIIWLERIATVFGIMAIIGGVYFIITIVDPTKYRKAVKIMYKEVKPKSEEGRLPREDFFGVFVDIEKKIRHLWETRTNQERLGSRKGPPAFREMLEALIRSEIISFKLYERLLLANRYRNVVFHGHAEEVDRDIIHQLREINDDLFSLTTGGADGSPLSR
jgi:hypothetical protein